MKAFSETTAQPTRKHWIDIPDDGVIFHNFHELFDWALDQQYKGHTMIMAATRMYDKNANSYYRMAVVKMIYKAGVYGYIEAHTIILESEIKQEGGFKSKWVWDRLEYDFIQQYLAEYPQPDMFEED